MVMPAGASIGGNLPSAGEGRSSSSATARFPLPDGRRRCMVCPASANKAFPVEQEVTKEWDRFELFRVWT